MAAKIVLIQTEIPEGRAVIAHFLQVIYDDSGAEIARAKNPHTVCFMPDADHAAILAEVNADITTREGMKWAPIGADEWARAVGHCAVEHTPPIVAAYVAYKEEKARQREAARAAEAEAAAVAAAETEAADKARFEAAVDAAIAARAAEAEAAAVAAAEAKT